MGIAVLLLMLLVVMVEWNCFTAIRNAMCSSMVCDVSQYKNYIFGVKGNAALA
jgi:hypothetical protein